MANRQPRRAQDADGFLITEAIRGEGAVLVDQSGERFIDELAPRDEVARAVQRRMDATGASSVGLDMRAVDPALFPNVIGALRQAGIDPKGRRFNAVHRQNSVGSKISGKQNISEECLFRISSRPRLQSWPARFASNAAI